MKPGLPCSFHSITYMRSPHKKQMIGWRQRCLFIDIASYNSTHPWLTLLLFLLNIARSVSPETETKLPFHPFLSELAAFFCPSVRISLSSLRGAVLSCFPDSFSISPFVSFARAPIRSHSARIDTGLLPFLRFPL